MRSRTECVTTTYHDESSDEDAIGNDSDESDDWKPSESKKKTSTSKRKAPAKKSVKKANKKKKYSSEDEVSEISEDDYSDENEDYVPVSTVKKTASKKFETYTDNQIFDLFINIKDINENYKENNKICLWKKDGNSLLQKFIRVKTPNKNEFIFTTSTVYASWQDERKDDLKTIGVKFVPENKKRVTIANPDDLKLLLEAKSDQSDDTNKDDTSDDENN